ncbi:trace amine-associated receptor 3-like [Mastacembelus armatus]|uniref:trace amine-associated receptor 3-like n=1 Tax=Mastacembelus armatus TaxID=205130 RepID=UPI000E4628E3|nr:trace amine-associated receptor 3-like [Mastacembelus armatus]
MSSCCRQLHSPTNLIVLSLAVSDFIMGFLVMPIEILMMWTCWVLGDLMCSLYFLLPMTIISATVGNIVLISIDRYVAICDPLHYPTRITERTITIGNNIMVGSKIEAFLSFLMFSNSGLNPLIYALFYPWFRKAMKHIVTLQILKPGSREANMLQLHSPTNLIILSLAVSDFIMGFLVMPNEILMMWTCWVLGDLMCSLSIMIGSAIEAFVSFLAFSNSGLNPLIYALFYPWFRKAMKHIVTLQILKPGSREANML